MCYQMFFSRKEKSMRIPYGLQKLLIKLNLLFVLIILFIIIYIEKIAYLIVIIK